MHFSFQIFRLINGKNKYDIVSYTPAVLPFVDYPQQVCESRFENVI